MKQALRQDIDNYMTPISIALLVLALMLSISYGAGPYDLLDFLRSSSDQQVVDVFLQSRLPRTLAAVLVGGGLALSATLLQTVTRNPLAEPGLLGVNAGGVLGLTIGLSYFAAASVQSFMLWSGGGALCAVILVLCIGSLAKRTSPPHLILIGIATSATLGGIANYILMSFATTLEQFRFWNLGSLSGVKLAAVTNTAPYFLASCLAIAVIARWLSVMQLGDDKAKTMGVPTGAVTLTVWITTAVLTACAISIAGPIMFAGFLAAYLARFVAGARFGRQLLYSWTFGVILLLISDLCARWIIRPFEVPVGVVVALIGTPLTILVAKSRTFRSALVREA